MQRRRPAIALAIASILGLMTALPAGATSPGGNGRITYAVSDDTGQSQIWIAGADESSPVKLTFVAKGYKAKDVSITPKDDQVLTIALDKVAQKPSPRGPVIHSDLEGFDKK